MDFLPRHFAYCALVGAFGLAFSASASSAVLDQPNYSWRLSSSGDVYRVYDPQGLRASSTFTPSSTFAEGSSSGVIETFAPGPLTIDGATGDVIAGLSRSLTVGDLVGGLTDAMSGPLGATIIAASNLLPFLQDIYNQYEASTPAGSLTSCTVSTPVTTALLQGSGYHPSDCTAAGTRVSLSDTAVNNFLSANWEYGCTSSPMCGCTDANATTDVTSTSFSTLSSADCSADGGTVGSVSPPSNIVPWIVNNWTSDNLASDASNVLNSNPSYGPLVGDSLASNNAPMPSPVPYVYNPSSNTLSEPSSTSTSTNPSTGDSTVTTTTPSFKVSPGTNGGLNVQKTSQVVTQTCTSAGSCTVTNTTTNTSTPSATPPVSPFVAPTTSIPAPSTAAVTDVPLTLSMPSQSNAVCPAPLSYSALGSNFTIPLTPLCNLATDARPYLESLGAVGAGIVIFR